MKTLSFVSVVLWFAVDLLGQSTINPGNSLAAGANLGWLNLRGRPNDGAAISEYVCSGYIYAANVGWIHLGDSTPENLIRYQNNTETDYGVNFCGGLLRGLAWSANAGWINFENIGDPRIDHITGKFSGLAWGANVGWISLSNAVAFVQTDSVQPAVDSDSDGLPDRWEIENGLDRLNSVDAGADHDGDGRSNYEEYLAGTNPRNPSSRFEVASRQSSDLQTDILTWPNNTNRVYRIERRLSLDPGAPWVDSGLGLISPAPAGVPTVTRVLGVGPSPLRFYRIEARRPLSP